MSGIVATKNTPQGWADLRARRDRLLADCDWTQIPDCPLSPAARAAWTAYRQALRDMTSVDHIAQAVFPPLPVATKG